jgi:Uma2 family endonuclease
MEASRITRPKAERLVSAKDDRNDPYRYGWREVQHGSSNGKERWERIPLTLEDILHPEEEDFRVHTDAHNNDCAYLKYAISPRLPPDGLVLSDCRVDWGVKGLRPHGPDIAAFRGVRRRIDWATFHVGKEKARPLFIIEVTSVHTRVTDVETKVDHYYRAGVPHYFIVDAIYEDEQTRVLELIGYRRGKSAYVRMKPDANGRLSIRAVGLLLAVESGRARLYDAATGERIPDYQDAMREMETAKVRQRLAENRIRELEAEIRKLRGE